MYARVAVASNALDMGAIPPPVATALHGALIESLRSHGRLVFTSPEEALEFVRAVKETGGIPPTSRAKWTALLGQFRQSGRVVFADPPSETSLATVDAIDLLRAGWGRHAEIAVVAEAASTALGVPGDTGVLSDPGCTPDVAVAAAAPTAPALARIQQLHDHPVAAHGSDREEFWSTVLEPMATGAMTATILDGYLFANEARGGDHVVWMLEHLDSVMAGGATVRLLANSRHSRGLDPQKVAEAVRDRWAPLKVGRLSRVEVLLGTPSQGRRFPHDRHVRFSTGSAVKVPAGFDRLSEQRIWDTSGMWWTYFWQSSALDDLRDDEGAAETLAHHPEALVLSR
ncbi:MULTISPECIES: hypothetical protein [unclassified Nocardioides]|uniref:hypothetical protein n=1 Tax=unclassified Nocardioides TaxID=2615069 RepID=UPI00360A3707